MKSKITVVAAYGIDQCTLGRGTLRTAGAPVDPDWGTRSGMMSQSPTAKQDLHCRQVVYRHPKGWQRFLALR